MVLYCANCGAKNGDVALACRVCGKELETKGSGSGAIAFFVVLVILVVLAVAFVQPIRAAVQSLFLGTGNYLKSGTGNASGNITNNSSDPVTSNTVTNNTTKTSPPVPPETVQVTAVNENIINYNNMTGQYQNSTATGPGFTSNAGTVYPYTEVFSNGGTRPYVIRSILPSTAGFEDVGNSPKLPYVLNPGSSISITSFFRDPNATYTGILSIAISESLLLSPPTFWEEMTGASVTQNYTGLSFNVSAVPQVDSQVCGPMYAVSGLSSSGYDYKLGLAYDKCSGQSGNHAVGFGVYYSVSSPNGTTVVPQGGMYYMLSMNGTVNSGDFVLLSMGFAGGDVTMQAHDWNTGATGTAIVSDYGANTFVGSGTSPLTPGDYFTGIMTDWSHSYDYNGTENAVSYWPFCNGTACQNVWLWTRSIYGNQNFTGTGFSNSTAVPISPAANETFRFGDNVTISTDNGTLVIGSGQ
jgi:hypothetical protein